MNVYKLRSLCHVRSPIVRSITNDSRVSVSVSVSVDFQQRTTPKWPSNPYCDEKAEHSEFDVKQFIDRESETQSMMLVLRRPLAHRPARVAKGSAASIRAGTKRPETENGHISVACLLTLDSGESGCHGLGRASCACSSIVARCELCYVGHSDISEVDVRRVPSAHVVTTAA